MALAPERLRKAGGWASDGIAMKIRAVHVFGQVLKSHCSAGCGKKLLQTFGGVRNQV